MSGGRAPTLASFMTDAVSRGLPFAIARRRIAAAQPLDGPENWAYWGSRRPAPVRWLARAYPPRPMRARFLRRMLEVPHARGIEAHYDVCNDFYALFLDRAYRFYTCAHFEQSDQSLEDAQRAKAAMIHAMLRLDGDERVLDLGCGWGGMIRYLTDRGHRGHVTGLTLSHEQLAYAHGELGKDVRLCNFVTEPLPDCPWDRIVSIGSLEHVRPDELGAVYARMHAALRPGGRAVHQFFVSQGDATTSTMVMLQLFFPGSVLSTLSAHAEAARRAGFEIEEDRTDDYRPTLRAWHDRLASRREEAIELVGEAVYNRYMTFLGAAWLFFERGEGVLHRVAMIRPG